MMGKIMPIRRAPAERLLCEWRLAAAGERARSDERQVANV